MFTNPIFVVLEGGDGVGKSTALASIIEAFEESGIPFVVTREPGGTALGERIRELLLHDAMTPHTEALLMFASRQEHLAQVIAPKLDSGISVISDRFVDSSYAYQAGGRNMPVEKIESLQGWLDDYRHPDLTILLDVPVQLSMERVGTNSVPDRFERQGEEFFQAVRDAYLARAANEPNRFRLINAGNPVEMVREDVKAAVVDFLAHQPSGRLNMRPGA